jgi:hypothetical protein
VSVALRSQRAGEEVSLGAFLVILFVLHVYVQPLFLPLTTVAHGVTVCVKMEGTGTVGKDGEKKHRARFMGKLFKEKKESTSQDEVDDFLRGPSDKLHMMPTAPATSFPPSLTRIDTGRAPRWPEAAEVQAFGGKRSISLTRKRKGLVVRFSDSQPEVIGEGGDEATSPVSEIGFRKKSHAHPPGHQLQQEQSFQDHVDLRVAGHGHGQGFAEQSNTTNVFQPGPIRRTQTGYDSIPDIQHGSRANLEHEPRSIEARDGSSNYGLSEAGGDRRSFSERVKAEIRSGEGLALVRSHGGHIDELFARSEPPEPPDVNIIPHMEEVQLNTLKNSQLLGALELPEEPSGSSNTPNNPQFSGHLDASPASLSKPPPLEGMHQQASLPIHPAKPPLLPETLAVISTPLSINQYNSSPVTNNDSYNPASLTRTPTLTLQEVAAAVGDDALQEFSARTAHSFTLFRLSTEAVKPLASCSLEDLTRASLWWFIKGRLQLEATIRDRPPNMEAQRISMFVRQQAYTDLAKSLWLSEIVLAHHPEIGLQKASTDPMPLINDVVECQKFILSSLRKLAMSMKRNNILPPDVHETPLLQGLDATIWAASDGNRSLLTSQRITSTTSLAEAFPLGDTSRTFFFNRMFAEAVLSEDAASQQYRCPVLVSVVRNQKENAVTVIISNQDGTLNISIQSDRTRGTTWNDVRWQAKHNSLEIALPRGFVLRLRCSEPDFRMLWGTYEYDTRTRAMMDTREGEDLIFETVLRSFQFFEQTPQSAFPKESQPHCYLRVFERSTVQKAATGPRKMHRGFRIGLNTNTRTKALWGIDQKLPPIFPIQFGLLRGEGGSPAFLLKIEDARTKYTIVSTFDNANDRTRLHTLLTGVALGESEEVVAEAPIKGLSISVAADSNLTFLQDLEWQNFRVINYDEGDIQSSKTVLSGNLRIIVDFKTGTLTDRINVAPGELKLRLDVNSQTKLKVLRQPQQDLTISVSEAQVAKELPRDLARLLSDIEKSESIRVYTFPTTKELHLFQAALTGHEVLFDGMACSFNISRRRMVVPIYKKWDAALTRLQIVQKEKVIQLLAFFENFTHGDCMNFALKSTDIFETSAKGGKFSVRIVDAKFAMPKLKERETAIDHEFVCLDMPEYPGEHDDITIVFETEAGKPYCPIIV